jgi:hypothetical protein
MYTQDGMAVTLRTILMGLTFPVNAAPTAQTSLFHMVDPAVRAATPGIILFVYDDARREFAARLLEVLPAYIWTFYGDRFVREWFHSTSFDILDQVTFEVDTEEEDFTVANWTGNWETEDSRLTAQLNNEAVPGGIRIEGMEAVEQEEHRVLHAVVDDQSAFSFISRAQSEDSNGSADSTQTTSSGSATGGSGEAGTLNGPGPAA